MGLAEGAEHFGFDTGSFRVESLGFRVYIGFWSGLNYGDDSV